MTQQAPAPPPWLRTLWRGTMFIMLAAFFTMSAMVMRALIGGFGGNVGPIALAAVATAISGIVVLPLAPLIDWPLAIFSHWLPEQRMKRGNCPRCGYSAQHVPTGECPECGAPLRAPAPYTAGWPTLRRVVVLAVPAWVTGCAIGLSLVLHDEQSFVIEVENRNGARVAATDVARPRVGVAGFGSLRWSAQDGFSGPPPYASPKEKWKPK